MNQFERISHDIDIMGGKACVKGTRITVDVILMLISEGASFSDILAEYPLLTTEDITEALRYAAWIVGTKDEVVLSVRPPFEYNVISDSMWMSENFDAPLDV